MYECDWWNLYNSYNIVKQHLHASFCNKIPLKEERRLENMKFGSIFGYVQCNIGVPENLVETFANIPPIPKNINVDRDDIRPFMKEYAEDERILTQPQRKLKSADFWRREQSWHRCCSFNWTWSWFARDIITLWNSSDEVLQQPCSVCSEC